MFPSLDYHSCRAKIFVALLLISIAMGNPHPALAEDKPTQVHVQLCFIDKMSLSWKGVRNFFKYDIDAIRERNAHNANAQKRENLLLAKRALKEEELNFLVVEAIADTRLNGWSNLIYEFKQKINERFGLYLESFPSREKIETIIKDFKPHKKRQLLYVLSLYPLRMERSIFSNAEIVRYLARVNAARKIAGVSAEQAAYDAIDALEEYNELTPSEVFFTYIRPLTREGRVNHPYLVEADPLLKEMKNYIGPAAIKMMTPKLPSYLSDVPTLEKIAQTKRTNEQEFIKWFSQIVIAGKTAGRTPHQIADDLFKIEHLSDSIGPDTITKLLYYSAYEDAMMEQSPFTLGVLMRTLKNGDPKNSTRSYDAILDHWKKQGREFHENEDGTWTVSQRKIVPLAVTEFPSSWKEILDTSASYRGKDQSLYGGRNGIILPITEWIKNESRAAIDEGHTPVQVAHALQEKIAKKVGDPSSVRMLLEYSFIPYAKDLSNGFYSAAEIGAFMTVIRHYESRIGTTRYSDQVLRHWKKKGYTIFTHSDGRIILRYNFENWYDRFFPERNYLNSRSYSPLR